MTTPQYQPEPFQEARNWPDGTTAHDTRGEVTATARGDRWVPAGGYQPAMNDCTFEPAPQHGHRAPARAVMSGAASFWYVLGCIGFGAAYFAKVPAKKALAEAGLAEMTAAERFWYALQCIAFGAGYFAKLPVKKALTEMH